MLNPMEAQLYWCRRRMALGGFAINTNQQDCNEKQTHHPLD
jgi:hypothetical protein